MCNACVVLCYCFTWVCIVQQLKAMHALQKAYNVPVAGPSAHREDIFKALHGMLPSKRLQLVILSQCTPSAHPSSPYSALTAINTASDAARSSAAPQHPTSAAACCRGRLPRLKQPAAMGTANVATSRPAAARPPPNARYKVAAIVWLVLCC